MTKYQMPRYATLLTPRSPWHFLLLPGGDPIFTGLYPDGRQTLVWHEPGSDTVALRCLDADGAMVYWSEHHRSLVEAQLDAGRFWDNWQSQMNDVTSTGGLPVD